MLVHLPPPAEKALRSSEFISSDVSIVPNSIMRWSGARTRSSRSTKAASRKKPRLRDWFTAILGSEQDALELIHRCQRMEVHAGEIIVSAGDAANSMHFILDGRVGVMIPAGRRRTTRVRSLGRYTTIGEMGLVARAPRNATIQAEVASVLYVLNVAPVRGDQDRKSRTQPETADVFRLGDGRAADLCQSPDRRAPALG